MRFLKRIAAFGGCILLFLFASIPSTRAKELAFPSACDANANGIRDDRKKTPIIGDDGANLNYGSKSAPAGFVLANPHVQAELVSLYREINNSAGDVKLGVVVTGGDRYRDELNQIRSSTNDGIIQSNCINCYHEESSGRIAADIAVFCKPDSGCDDTYTPQRLKEIAQNAKQKTKFKLGYYKDSYSDGHTHVGLAPQADAPHRMPLPAPETCAQ